MKRKFVSLLLVAILLCTAFVTVLIGCNNAKITYSVTVLMPDETTPVEGVTVEWQQSGKSVGSAVTGGDGKASADLVAGNYNIVLSGMGTGFSYTSLTVGSSLRDITIPLVYNKALYSATVIDKDGNVVEDAEVLWMKDSEVVARIRTNADGVATCELNYDTYSVTVSADTLPENNVFNGGAKTVTGEDPNVQFDLEQGLLRTFEVSVITEGGLNYPNLAMNVYLGNVRALAGKTNEDGVFIFKLAVGEYRVEAVLPNGYTGDSVTVGENKFTAEIKISSSVIESEPSAGTKYVMGDIIHDFTFTTAYEVDGSPKSYSISELLKTKKAVLINNWGINCSWCIQEMPAMEEAYQEYKDEIELIALDNYMGGDTDSQIIDYREAQGYTFPMIRDSVGFASHFNFTGWPTTVVIDRYGAIARIEAGAILDAKNWGRLIQKYISDDYVQDFVPGTNESDSITSEVAKPDITVPDDHYEKIAEAVNNFSASDGSVTWFGDGGELIWPFVIGTVDDISPDQKVLYASNSFKANSIAALYATVNVKAGKMLTFEYYADTEKDSDILSVIWDGIIVTNRISGSTDGWQKCYVYSELTDDPHTLALAYVKDSSKDAEKDNVYIRNVHFVDIGAIDETMDIMRSAAYGEIERDENGTPVINEFPYYAPVEIGSDGYYHVRLSGLVNSEFAGNDSYPLLLANLLTATPWNGKSILTLITETDDKTGEYINDCNFTINGVKADYRDTIIEYLTTAMASDIDYCVPVDAELQALLAAFMANVSGDDSHSREWLEICFFYSHYGDGEPKGNPIIGITEKTAIPIGVGTHTADLTRVMAPFPKQIFSFEPTESGVYFFESFIPRSMSARYSAQIWVYDDENDRDHPIAACGEYYFTRDGQNEYNFSLYLYLTAGHKYYVAVAYMMQESGSYDFSITRVGESADILTSGSYDIYWTELDSEGNMIMDSLYLAGAVEYELDDDGYYHAINADGTRGDFIYFDVKYATAIGGSVPAVKLVDMLVTDPVDNSDLDFKMFDFRKSIAYYTEVIEEDGKTYYYSTREIVDMTDWGDAYIDYTEIMKNYVASADEDGFVKVDQQLVKILSLFIELRVNHLHNDVYEDALDNEWLRFCWYYKHYDAQNQA